MTAGASDAERWIGKVRSRHETAVELSRRTGMGYDPAYRLLKDAEAHPWDVDRQLALRRALASDDPGPRSRSEPASRAEVRAVRPVPPARSATRVRSVTPARPPSGDDLPALLYSGLAAPVGSRGRVEAEAVRDEIIQRHSDAVRQRGVADAIVRIS